MVADGEACHGETGLATGVKVRRAQGGGAVEEGDAAPAPL